MKNTWRAASNNVAPPGAWPRGLEVAIRNSQAAIVKAAYFDLHVQYVTSRGRERIARSTFA